MVFGIFISERSLERFFKAIRYLNIEPGKACEALESEMKRMS